MRTSRFIGGILLIVGTSIGGGMLALPVANAATGFWQSSIFLFLCWVFMTLGAFFILEANLYLPRGKHMVSMAQATLGNYGLLLAWVSYLFLLYTLLSAYISGGADVLNSLLFKVGLHLQDWQASFLFTLFFGLVVYGGIYYVDYVNRGLMFGKLAVYFLLIVLIAPHIEIEHLHHGDMGYIGGSIMILITSFGFAIIVPNLRDYFDDDIKQLKKVIFIGSLIPLFCYLAWDAVIMGALPSEGSQNLESLMSNPHTTSALASMLSNKVQNTTISALFNFFTSICMLTAFLGVSLCLYSFLADGLKLRERGSHGLGLFLLTFVPPLLIVIYYPGAYIHALGYAGIFCIILLLFLPALMCYFGRKYYSPAFSVPGGKLTQIVVIAISIGLLVHELWKLIG
ncbi:amino acid permease [Legionella longbeachae]|uniref:Putative tyrosine-specific transport protein n=1 Tax=Legionella longbeachae serogroup 1 (strain NSW150) TaxID=661367 RepID=D3HKI7_LEGLN|nr:aromatic amino acid transport family protein [Legionella longbeachae]VEE03468.1 tyrosine-specific transport protein [Legionella oakridgensis]HBD7397747.1 tryptophan/tyrosine permease [Legionella pneumophila]ARB93638.1 tryptophan/tyrosine permease [Legionella longbeachae]ARM33222.1 tryptophan/tyrosine permease [Legionella longbeachae]EEZ93921.1 tryptophan/tyrosine permease family [Legionella longbeachae D-4968]